MVLESSLGINIHSRNQSRVNGILDPNHLVLADRLFTAKDNHCLISLVTTGIHCDIKAFASVPTLQLRVSPLPKPPSLQSRPGAHAAGSNF